MNNASETSKISFDVCSCKTSARVVQKFVQIPFKFSPRSIPTIPIYHGSLRQRENVLIRSRRAGQQKCFNAIISRISTYIYLFIYSFILSFSNVFSILPRHFSPFLPFSPIIPCFIEIIIGGEISRFKVAARTL